MPQGNPTTHLTADFVAGANALFATAYLNNIDCPPLRALGQWLEMQLGATPISGQRPAVDSTPTTNFDAAALAAINSSPNGVPLTDLVSILKHYGRPNNQVAAALARLEKKGTIKKIGELWYGATADPNGKVDRTMPGRRRTRASRGRAATRAGAAAAAG